MLINNQTNIRHTICLGMLIITCFVANAQKLPNKQQGGLHAPKIVKIDGKLTEWGDDLQAYNNAVGLQYTIANDEDHLYLVIQARDIITIKKMLIGGCTFTVNVTGKDDKSGVSITFPLIKEMETSSIGIRLDNAAELTAKPNQKASIDSIIRLTNVDMGTKTKEIKVKGITQVPDTLISIFNDLDIRAAIRFDSDPVLNYELSLPLSYLGNNITNGKFHYNLMLNGMSKQSVKVFNISDSRGPVTVMTMPQGLANMGSSRSRFNPLNFAYPTDFWGEYTLAK